MRRWSTAVSPCRTSTSASPRVTSPAARASTSASGARRVEIDADAARRSRRAVPARDGRHGQAQRSVGRSGAADGPRRLDRVAAERRRGLDDGDAFRGHDLEPARCRDRPAGRQDHAQPAGRRRADCDPMRCGGGRLRARQRATSVPSCSTPSGRAPPAPVWSISCTRRSSSCSRPKRSSPGSSSSIARSVCTARCASRRTSWLRVRRLRRRPDVDGPRREARSGRWRCSVARSAYRSRSCRCRAGRRVETPRGVARNCARDSADYDLLQLASLPSSRRGGLRASRRGASASPSPTCGCRVPMACGWSSAVRRWPSATASPAS